MLGGVALLAPTERTKTQMYTQRYLLHLGAAGEVAMDLESHRAVVCLQGGQPSEGLFDG